MNSNKICIDSIRSLTKICPNKIVHFCRVSARLVGKLALREQFLNECNAGECSSLAMAEVDSDGLQEAIVRCARDCADTMYRLNTIAKQHGIKEPMNGIKNMNLSDVIEAINSYVTTLIGSSDFREWVDDYDV